MKSSELRTAFVDFFKTNGHEYVESSSLVPGNDPTLLFTNAGMNQFKDVFLGQGTRTHKRAVSVQRCVRAGGKHNDLDNVGYTSRHHTFFEMLGNFSFGDYGKREAIRFAWQFLTQIVKLPPEKLWVTVHQHDEEAEQIWLKEIGHSAGRFARLGDIDNFWSMGDTGPCGPCSEIFYDHGPEIAGGPPGSSAADGERYVEIWNMVFMQYNRSPDGELTPLPRLAVDTGMGLERLTAVLQGAHDNYATDLFRPLLEQAALLLDSTPDNSSVRVIADHIRSCAFLVADGVEPSNEGRGYVLRRIIRRACRHGYKLKAGNLFFHKMVPVLIQTMGSAARVVAEAQHQIEDCLQQEEKRFSQTLDRGLHLLEQDLSDSTTKQIPGKLAFLLYDTYGFPLDLTADIARERGLTLDTEGYAACMEAQRRRARASSRFQAETDLLPAVEGSTGFVGYDTLILPQTRIKALWADGKTVATLDADDQGMLLLESTPFYAEAGGQCGDTGMLESESGRFRVLDTRKRGDHHWHLGKVVAGHIKAGQELSAVVDADRRGAVACNHSATHLVHAALTRVLGSHVQQRGSQITPERLRFDFSHKAPVSPEQLASVVELVNEQVRCNTAVITEVTDMHTARERGAGMLPGEQYGSSVRMLSMGKNAFSFELCGGTHVERTGDLGQFVIVGEMGVAAGVRRIEALTGQAAQNWLTANDISLLRIGQLVKGNRETAVEKVQLVLDQKRELEKDVQLLRQKLVQASGESMVANARDLGDVKLLAARIEDVDPSSLRGLVDHLKQRLGSRSVVLLAVETGSRVSIAAGVAAGLTGRVAAGDLVRMIAGKLGGRGGGRSDFAQGAGPDVASLPTALASVEPWLLDRLQQQ
ncbi:MAG: alanine--tRNA ligase [Kistimonas sp.]|nr:alanine--tRNA ligase [Kistimonas sp.]